MLAIDFGADGVVVIKVVHHGVSVGSYRVRVRNGRGVVSSAVSTSTRVASSADWRPWSRPASI